MGDIREEIVHAPCGIGQRVDLPFGLREGLAVLADDDAADAPCGCDEQNMQQDAQHGRRSNGALRLPQLHRIIEHRRGECAEAAMLHRQQVGHGKEHHRDGNQRREIEHPGRMNAVIEDRKQYEKGVYSDPHLCGKGLRQMQSPAADDACQNDQQRPQLP